jgi:hypothetical protein
MHYSRLRIINLVMTWVHDDEATVLLEGEEDIFQIINIIETLL